VKAALHAFIAITLMLMRMLMQFCTTQSAILIYAKSALKHLFWGVALLNEGGPHGSWSYGVHPDASGDEVRPQALSEGGHCSLQVHKRCT